MRPKAILCSLALASLVLTPLACSEESYRLVLSFPDRESFNSSVAGELFVAEGSSCTQLEGSDAEPRVSFDPHGDSPALEGIELGQVAFLAELRDQSCALIVEGCVEVELEPGVENLVRIALQHADQTGCGAGEGCQAGRCLVADAGTTDAGGADFTAVDAALVDATETDAAAADAAAADAAAPDTANADATGIDVAATDTGVSDITGSDASVADASGTDGAAADVAALDAAGLDAAVMVDAGTGFDVGAVTDGGTTVDPANSSITGTSPVTADGVSASTVTITLRDALSAPVVGVVPTFTCGGSANAILDNCGATDSSGVSTCVDALRSTLAETKQLALTSPVVLFGGSVEFVAGPASAVSSIITGTSPVLADGYQASTLTVTLLDAHANPLIGVQPSVGALGTAVAVTQSCGPTSSGGVSTCVEALRSTVAETKQLRITAPVAMDGDTVDFVERPVAPPGYTPRPCGFDMDRDGFVGGARDCDVCDGVTTDPDHDGVDEDLIYVDGDGGSDSSGDGSPGAPFLTVAQALSVADGPGDGAEEIICLRGTIREEIDLDIAGVAGVYIVDDVELPTDPMMVVGWDTDDDGQYPPYDTDDVVLLDGDGAWESGFDAADADAGFVEVAHLVALRFTNTDPSGDDDAFYVAYTSDASFGHHYLHDIEADQLHAGVSDSGDQVGVLAASWGSNELSHFTVSNNAFTRAGATVLAAWSEDTLETVKHLRFDHNTVTLEGPDGGDASFFWAVAVDHLQILDNVVDGRPDEWNADWSGGALVEDCNADVLVARNWFTDLEGPIDLDADAVGCADARPISAVVDRNVIYNESYGSGSIFAAIYVHAAHDAGRSIDDVMVTNNVITAAAGHEYEIGIYAAVGNSQEEQYSRLVIAGNTVRNTTNDSLILDPDANTFHCESVWIMNNVFAGQDDPESMSIDWTPTLLVSNHNVFDAAQINDSSLADWRSATGQDLDSVVCAPSFLPGPTAPLAPGDTCARGVGRDILFLAHEDVEGDPRSHLGGIAGANVDPGAADIVFQDHFLRTTGDRLGAGWSERDPDREWEIWNGYVLTDTDTPVTVPIIAQRSFVPRSSGALRWSFLVYLEHRAGGLDYNINMQLGSEASFQDSDPDAGAAVYLRWGGTVSGLSSEHGIGVIESGGITEFDTLNDDLAIFDIEVDLDQRTYDVYMNDSLVLSGVDFFASVPIDTVRFYSDGGEPLLLFDAVRVEALP